ncbi:methylmalonyl-CoA mutase subunit beta [Salibacteraceae bacterium]|nr:methylmalonyl-CoA mutase subunit beta [Salibacteraceae bacterium]MDB0058404.1 methylmalonyl-CoA mutase subunit beta [Salibacteraceae bacterium]MDC1204561.1 methylmalonyl-CoA mutase subunit beta [Salibacteraceae bacterium]
MKNERLFSDFPPFSNKEWKAQIEKDLKGKPYEDLIKENVLGSTTEPVYTSSENLYLPNARRGVKSENNDWAIYQTIQLSNDTKSDNTEILDLLNKGLTGIKLKGDPTADTLLNIAPEYINTEFSDYSSLEQLSKVIAHAFGKEKNAYQIHLNFDPISKAAITGNWSNKKQELLPGIDAIKGFAGYKGLRVFTVNAGIYHNCGAGAVSEIGLALAQAHEYLVELLESGISIDDASAQIKIELAIGRDFFSEIAKFRAFRMLWSRMIEEYNPKHSCSKSIVINAQTSEFWNTVYDPYVNMLRATTQAMSASLGGVDGIEVKSYNSAWEEGNEFSHRVARNVQLLLKEESYFDKVIDPAGGSYYIEQLTQELAEKAWLKFQKIEKKGGFIGLVTSGNLHRELQEEASAQIAAFEKRDIKVLGVNLYSNQNEKALDRFAISAIKDEKNKFDFSPIQPIRIVGKAEEERLSKELEEIK